MDTTILSWYQALQLLALGPCLFMIFFLCVTARHPSKVIVPALYFLSLSCSFLLPLTDALGLGTRIHGVLFMGESLTPALSFLLIIQFITGNIPSLIYWSILAVPLVGGSSIIYAMLISKGEVCLGDNICTGAVVFKTLYEIFSASLTFLLTVIIYHRLMLEVDNNSSERKNKYALIIALIMLNLSLLAIELLQISGHVQADSADNAITVVRIGFIYLVLTSFFRVFDHSVEIDFERVPTIKPVGPSPRDMQLADNIRKLLADDKIYRSMDLNRDSLAKKLAVTENQLSRVINQCFQQNFSMLVNQRRVEEAKERLSKEKTAITVIAFEVGFSSIPSFNRVFKAFSGVSPTEYRSKNSAGT